MARCTRSTSSAPTRRSRSPTARFTTTPSNAGCTAPVSTCGQASPLARRPLSHLAPTRCGSTATTCTWPSPRTNRRYMSTLEIRDLHVSVAGQAGESREILRGVDLTVAAGQTHAIMGPNGSGKSTLAYSIAGHPRYQVTSGSVTLDGEDVLAMSVDARARAGLFLAMQYPVEVPGVTVSNFLRTAVTAVRGEAPRVRDFLKEMNAAMKELSIDPAFAQRNLNEGFSGGEKKRHEILQLRLLNPKIAILDETDSGLDIDALKVVAAGVNAYGEEPDHGVLLITHYTRILRYVRPDFVHVFVGGKIAAEGGPELADELEASGYERFSALADGEAGAAA